MGAVKKKGRSEGDSGKLFVNYLWLMPGLCLEDRMKFDDNGKTKKKCLN